ncbi:MAG TPA: CapA family protein [Bacteroidia bacterium]|nr:CapA family protein [Bacteroidia bacterium]
MSIRFQILLGVYLALTGAFNTSCKQTQSKPAEIPVIKPADTPVTEVIFVFAGDIMQHGPQIRAALTDSAGGVYDYAPCFANVADIAKSADFTIANLELTLAGEPYTGYPQFSAPDALATDLKKAGFRYLVTANNHSCDRLKKGVERTVHVLDSFGIPRTGTFKNAEDRAKNNIMWLEKDGLKVALLNYTYGTNGIKVPEPTIVNLLDSAVIKTDLQEVKKYNPDKIIVFTHWGAEYQHQPNAEQKAYARYIFSQGADYIIGSHPHVLQPMEMMYDSVSKTDKLVVWSLGNFVSNQRDRYKDGGAMFKLVLQKKEKSTTVKEAGYILTWVDIAVKNGDKDYIIYPVSQYENDSVLLDKQSLEKMRLFRDDSRKLLGENNKRIGEYVWKDGKWQLAN